MTTMADIAQVFDLRTPYLKAGRTTENRSRTDNLTVTIKVYAEGGENAMHNHSLQDHAFVVLEGEATFHLETDENVLVVGPYEGIMLPKGANYWFQSAGQGNLVLLRVAARVGERGHGGRLTPDGRPMPADSEENKRGVRVELPGKGFGSPGGLVA
ncbi:MAG: cupin domain-containing protein [Dehalococcoidia bacterium]|nr:cupin domain-containing protein [Dehalococcoidia bacterium]